MRMVISLFDNSILFEEDKVFVLEIENRENFSKIVNHLNNISLGEKVEEIVFFDSNLEEVNLNGKINIIIDYFNINFNSNKINQIITKLVEDNISNDGRDTILKSYNKINFEVKKSISKSDLPIEIRQEFCLEPLVKMLKLTIKKDIGIIENLLTLLDIEKISGVNKLIVLVNIKDYLSKEELIELYKYAIYNGIFLLLIDSKSYGVCLKYEKKLIIDENFDEFMI